MSLVTLFRLRDRRNSARRHPRALRPSLHPSLDHLESRTVMAAPAAVAPLSNIGALVPIAVQSISNVSGNNFNVNLLVGNVLQTVTGSISASPNPDPAATCPILHLMINPIHLNLLGLKVDTSAICLDLDALPAPGNLLGNLLCDVSHLLDSGSTLQGILGGLVGGLSTSEINTVTSGLTGLLGGALDSALSPSTPTASVAGTTCDILHLSVGPVNLNLLGLEVNLNNCAEPNPGPVVVDISAQPGSGNLLGNLLCNVSHLLDTNASPTAINAQLNSVARVIDGLV